MNALTKPQRASDTPITRVLHDSTFYLLGSIASRILGFLAIPFYSHYLTPAEYGVIELIELSTQVIALSFGLQTIGTVLSRLFHDQETPDKEASIVSTSVLGTGLLSALICIGGVLAARPLSLSVFHSADRTTLLQVAFIAMWFANMVEVSLVYQRIRQRARFFFYYSMGILIANLGLNIYFIGFAGAGIWGFMYSKLIVSIVGGVFLLYRVLREVGLHWRRAYIPQFIRMGLPLLAASVSAFVIHFSDRFFLTNAVSLAEIGKYSLAYRFAMLVSVLIGESFNRSWGVTLYRLAREDGWKERFARVATYYVFVLYLTGLAIALVAPELFSFMVPRNFYPPYLLLPVLVAGYMFRETGDFFRSLLLINKRARMIGGVSFFGAAVNILLNFLLIPAFGIYGAALATLGTWAVYMLVFWVIAWQEHRVPFGVLAFAKVNVLALMIFALGDRLRLESVFVQTIVDVLWLALFIVFCLMLYLSRSQRTELLSIVKTQVVRLLSARAQPVRDSAPGLPKVVMVAYYFPPENVIGAARPARFSKYLSRLGFSVTVISQWIGGAEIDRPEAIPIPAKGPTPTQASADITTLRVPSPRSAHGVACFTSRLLGLLTRYLLPYDDRLPWIPFAYREAASAVAANPNAVVVSSHPPVATHLVALLLKMRHGGHWIADFRDPLARNPLRTSKRSIMLDAIFERLIFRHADIVIANTDAVKQIWQDRFPQWRHKIHLIWNGFDPEDEIHPKPISTRTRRTIAHIGTVYGGRTPWPLIESLDRLIAAGKLAAESIELHLLGPIQNQCLDPSAGSFQRLVALGALRIDNRMAPQAEARAEMLNADYLMLLDIVDNEVPGIQLPAKIFDYIRACRPVLAFTPADSVINRVLATAGIPSACIAPTASPADIDRAILDFLTPARTDVRPSEAFWHNFDAASQTYILANLISKISPSGASATDPAEPG